MSCKTQQPNDDSNEHWSNLSNVFLSLPLAPLHSSARGETNSPRLLFGFADRSKKLNKEPEKKGGKRTFTMFGTHIFASY
jgi:hypothetical protein